MKTHFKMLNSTSSDETKNEIHLYLLPIYLLLIMATFILNLHIIVIIIVRKKIHIQMNKFIASVCSCGLMSSIISMPFQLSYIIEDFQWSLSLNLCILWYIIDFSVCTAVLFNLIVIMYGRYMSIVKPYKDWLSNKIHLYALLTFTTFVPFIGWTITLYLFFPRIQLKGDCYFSADQRVLIFTDIIAFAIPLLALTAINIKLILELKKRSKKVFANIPVFFVKSSNQSDKMKSKGIHSVNLFEFIKLYSCIFRE